MQSLKCLSCQLVNFATDGICKRCGINLIPSPVEEVIYEATPEYAVAPISQNQTLLSETKRKTSFGDVFSAVLWILFIPYLCLDFVFLLVTLQSATGAPQEAAGAAMAAAFAIIPYCIARAVSEINALSNNK